MKAVLRAGELNRPSDQTRISVEMRDAVELWARQHGRHGKIGWNGIIGCAVIDFDLKADDPRMKAWREGRLRVEPKETVLLHYQPSEGAAFRAIDLEQLGVSGLIEMLDRANTWSGRGEYSSLFEAVQAVGRFNEDKRERERAAIRDAIRYRTRDLDSYNMRAFSTVPEQIGE